MSATRAQIGMPVPCPGCKAAVTVPIQSTLPPAFPISPQPQDSAQTTAILRAKKKRKSEFAGSGAAVQAIGLLLCFTVVGAIVGIPQKTVSWWTQTWLLNHLGFETD
jgi:hypothetical protein